MSKINKRFSRAVFVCAAILLPVFVSFAQDLELNIKVDSLVPETVRIKGEFSGESTVRSNKNWSFAHSIAGTDNLGARISTFNLIDLQDKSVSFKKLTAGEYLSDAQANSWSFAVDAKPLSNITAMAHISWIKGEQGILILGDLLPQFAAENNQPVSARIKFELPEGWKIVSREKNSGENTFVVENVERAIFLIGKNWRESEISGDKISLNLAISGEWQFSDAEATETAAKIFKEYQKLFGANPGEKIQISLVRFPKETKSGRWEAETRGANLTVVSSDMPFKTTSLQRLHEQLRHELFHLWIPNQLALTGNYDWFYEGFTVYQALKTGVQTNQIRFEDFLDTLSQAYNLDNWQSQKVSLIESSKVRWSGAGSPVYARGMVVAFLCDVALLRRSNGNRSIADIFREIYQKHHAPNKLEDGNAAVLRILENYKELQPFVEKYVSGADKINWEADLDSAGIKAAETNSVTKLEVKDKINGKQKDLLNELGYNNWRKISEK